jgi:hypothetical protein
VVVQELRLACQTVAEQAQSVWIDPAQIPLYAASIGDPAPVQAPLLAGAEREDAAWYWLTLNAVNFGSGWFPTLRKRPGRTGYSTVSGGLRRRFDADGPWSARELAALDAGTVAAVLDQDPEHELMALFAGSLNDLGAQLLDGYEGDPLALIRTAGYSATGLLELIGAWPCFADVSVYAGLEVPFYKRGQILAADLARSGAAQFDDLDRLTMFADNLVPHVLRLDGILGFAPELVARIDAAELIEHGSPEEVEIRACALHAVELIVAASSARVDAAQIDSLLWQRGQGRRYKGSPRHRSRSTAY